MSERGLDAMTWREFFRRPGERQMDAEGYWSSRMVVRLVFPHYANDAAAAARIEAEITRRGLRTEYEKLLREIDSPTPDQRRCAALTVVLAHQA